MTEELKGIHAKTFQDLDVIKDVLKLDEEKIAELEKENKELKDKNKALEQYADLADAKVDEVKGNLTKAKVCLEQLVSEITVGELEVDPNVLQQAENFLKEE